MDRQEGTQECLGCPPAEEPVRSGHCSLLITDIFFGRAGRSGEGRSPVFNITKCFVSFCDRNAMVFLHVPPKSSRAHA